MQRLLASFILAISLGTSSAALSADQFNVGNWFGQAIYDDSNGKFSFCIMKADYVNGDTLGFGFSADGSFFISVANPTWRLVEGRTTQISIHIDRHRPIYAVAENVSSTVAAARFTEYGELYGRLRRGYVMTIRAAGAELYYELTGTYRALDRLVRCTLYETGVASNTGMGPSNPFAAQPANNSSTGNEGIALIDEADLLVMASNILSDAGISGYRFLSRQERQNFQLDFPVVWQGPGALMGVLTGIQVTDPVDMPLEGVLGALAANTISEDAAGCSGDFASGSRSEVSDYALPSRRVFAACRDANPDETYLVEYVFFVVGENEIYRIATLTFGDAARSSDQKSVSDNLFRSAAFTLSGQ